MDNPLYIRFRGRVLGPYDKPKLQALARRGQLSQMHELSPDSVNWAPASTYPELFVNEEIPQAAAAQQAAKTSRQTVDGEQEYRLASKKWWYRKNGSQVGPVEEAALRQSLAAGTLTLDDYVWADGMPEWLPARQVAELVPAQHPKHRKNISARSNDTTDKQIELSRNLCNTAVKSRPWVIFIAIIDFIAATLCIVLGFIFLVFSVSRHIPPLVVSGLFYLIVGMVGLVGGILLMSYASRLGALRFGKGYSSEELENVLDRSLKMLHTYWVFVAINLIVLLGIIVLGTIFFFIFVGSLPLEW